jgi:ADP-ribose pyrophosphatase
MGTRDGRGGSLSPPVPGRIDSEAVYEGRVVRLSVDTVRFPDGSEGQLEMIRHAGASAVLPFLGGLLDPNPDVLLVRQYRYASDGYLYEVPAGLPAGPEESWEECAHRELEEETGMRAARMTPLTHIYTTPGFTDEVIRLFVATNLEPGELSRDADEFMEVVRISFSEALEMVRDGRIVDAKSIATILFTDRFVRDDRSGNGPTGPGNVSPR